jgi:Sigma-70 region 2
VGELSSRSHGADEVALAWRAAAGDVHAFLTLYRRNQRRVYDLCFRILGSQVEAADATRETFVGVLRGAPSLLAAAREACHRRLDLPGVAAHEREVLALSELEHLSYEEIAEIMGIDWDSVAQLHDWALAPEAEVSEDCERALPLIALEQEGALDDDSNDGGWLTEHLMHCGSCRAARDAMREADRDEPAPTPRHRLRYLTVAAALVGLSALALWVAVSHEGPLALIVPVMEEEPAAAPPKPAPPQNAVRPAEPAGARSGKKAARQKGRAERRDARQSARERRARKQRSRARADRARQRRANRARRPERPQRARRPRTGGTVAPSPKPEREGPPRQGHVERRPDRDGRDALVPAPSPAPPPSETAPDQPTPAPPSR